MPRKSLDAITDEGIELSALSGERVFDFTQPLDAMDADTKSVYYRLRRCALMAAAGDFAAAQGVGDATQLPDGKTYTEAQVVEILGEDYATGLVINKKCCN